MSIITKNFKRYAISTARYFLGGVVAYFLLVFSNSTQTPIHIDAALLMGAITAGSIAALKAIQEWLQSYQTRSGK